MYVCMSSKLGCEISSFLPTVIMVLLIPCVVCLCVTLLYCGQTSKRFELVFGISVAMEGNYFAVDSDPDSPTERNF